MSMTRISATHLKYKGHDVTYAAVAARPARLGYSAVYQVTIRDGGAPTYFSGGLPDAFQSAESARSAALSAAKRFLDTA